MRKNKEGKERLKDEKRRKMRIEKERMKESEGKEERAEGKMAEKGNENESMNDRSRKR